MLLIYGVTAIITGAVLAAVAALVPPRIARPTLVGRILGRRTVDALAVTLMCVGGLTLLGFLAEFHTQPAVPLQAVIAAILATAGSFALRAIRRRSGAARTAETPESLDPAGDAPPAGPEGPAPDAIQPNRAA